MLHGIALPTYLYYHFIHSDKDKLVFQMKRYGKFNIKLRYRIKETAGFLTEKFNITFIMLKKERQVLE